MRDEITLILLYGKRLKKLLTIDKDSEDIARFFCDQIDIDLLYGFDEAIQEDGLITDDYINDLYRLGTAITEVDRSGEDDY